MAKIKVSELTDELLDYWVAMASDLNPVLHKVGKTHDGGEVYIEHVSCKGHAFYRPSADWSQAGPIIDRMKPTSFYYWEPTDKWTCAWGEGPRWRKGETALVAAMRAYVASKFGEEVDSSTP